MTRTRYIIALIGSAILAGVIPNLFPAEKQRDVFDVSMFVLIVIVIPVLGFIRLRYQGISWTDSLPFLRVFKKD